MRCSQAQTRFSFPEVLAAELRELGAGDVESVPGGALFAATPTLACRVLLWVRSAARVLEPVTVGEIADFDTGMDKIRIDAADGATYDSLTDSSAIFNGVQQFLFIGQRGDDAFITYTDTSGGVSYGLTLANVDINDLTAANFDIV